MDGYQSRCGLMKLDFPGYASPNMPTLDTQLFNPVCDYLSDQESEGRGTTGF
jgi:uncharacterized protein YbbC (DUF1343 family)